MTFPFPIISPRSQAWVTSFSITNNNATGGGYGDYSFRAAVPASAISTSGSTIRVTLEAEPSFDVGFDNVSIVERSGSTGDGTTTPTELKFSGASGVLITAGTSAVSDALSYSLDETKSYLLCFDIRSAGNNYGYRTLSGTNMYYKAAANSYNTAAFTGSTDGGAQSWWVSKIEVLA